MAENPGRGYLPPTIPNPSNPLRRQNPLVSTQAPHSFYSAPQPYHVGHSTGIASKPYLQMLGSSSPQSEGIDLTARPTGQPEASHNGGDPVNGQVKENTAPGVIVIAPNPLTHDDEPVKPSVEPQSESVASAAESWEWKGVESFRSADFNVDSRINKTPAAIASATAPAAVPSMDAKNPSFHPLGKRSDHTGIPSPFEGKGPPSVSVIAPNPLVQPGEPRIAESGGFAKETWDRRYDPYRPSPDLAKRSSPLGPLGPVPGDMPTLEAKPMPAVHLSVATPSDQAGIPPLFDNNCPPSVCEGAPSHPVESKVVARSREGGTPVEPTIEPAAAVPEVAPTPTDHRQLANLGVDNLHKPPLQSTLSIAFQLQGSDPPESSPKASESASPTPIAEPSIPAPNAASVSPDPSAPDPTTERNPALSSAKSGEKQLAPENVESLLENMFGAGESPLKLSIPEPTNAKAPALTEDKVVAILEDKTPLEVSKSENEVAVKPKLEPTEVESELEKMFAGIIEPADETETSSLGKEIKQEPGVSAAASGAPSASSTPSSSLITSKKKKRLPRPRVRKSVDSDVAAPSVKRGRKTGKHDSPIKTKKLKRPTHERFKDTSNDSHSMGLSTMTKKGPFVRIEGPKDRPKRVRIVNSGAKDEDERDGGLDKAMVRRKHNAQAENRMKGASLFPSTLSAKYNSANADVTWFCVFCKLRSNCERGLGHEPAGDLYGPYFLTVRSEPEDDPRVPKDSEVSAEQKRKGGGKAKSLRAANAAEQFILNMAKKSKKSSGCAEIPSGEQEIWVHEKCVLWAPGVYLVGPHLVGLAEAVGAASVTKCNYCNHLGASLGCVVRSCPSRCHYGCAVATRWNLDQETFISRCPNHIQSQKS